MPPIADLRPFQLPEPGRVGSRDRVPADDLQGRNCFSICPRPFVVFPRGCYSSADEAAKPRHWHGAV